MTLFQKLVLRALAHILVNTHPKNRDMVSLLMDIDNALKPSMPTTGVKICPFCGACGAVCSETEAVCEERRQALLWGTKNFNESELEPGSKQ